METILWYIAVPVTVVYLAQIAITFMGMDGFDGVDADFDGDLETEDGEGGTLQLFTFKNAVGFLLGLSWGALVGLQDCGWSDGASLLMGIGIGLLIVAIQCSVFYFMSKLERKNVPSLESAVGQTATVYLTIPEVIYGYGKVTVTVNGSKRVLDAFSTSGPIPTGSMCRVVEVVSDVLKVEPINNNQ